VDEEQDITLDSYGAETHPGFGMIKANRVSSSGGVSLFDSEIKHQHFVSITLSGATRKRELNRDWIYERDQIIEVWLSEAQWAQLVSSMNAGGTPMTIHRDATGALVPEIPFEPRLGLSRQEVHDTVAKLLDDIKKKLAHVEEKPSKANITALHHAVANAVANADYAVKTMDEHTEKSVAKARADIEAIVANAVLRGANLALPEVMGEGVGTLQIEGN